LPDQMSFVLTFPWRGFVLAMRDRDRANESEIAVFVFSVATKDFSHDLHLSKPIPLEMSLRTRWTQYGSVADLLIAYKQIKRICPSEIL
jgi:hypothetical protein